jgi:hypothetical protein
MAAVEQGIARLASFPDTCKHVMASYLGSGRRVASESFA